MATLVKFRKDFSNEIFAVFPQLKYNKSLHGNDMLTGYAHLGQHTAISTDYTRLCSQPANESEYAALKCELESIGYNLKICK